MQWTIDYLKLPDNMENIFDLQYDSNGNLVKKSYYLIRNEKTPGKQDKAILTLTGYRKITAGSNLKFTELYEYQEVQTIKSLTEVYANDKLLRKSEKDEIVRIFTHYPMKFYIQNMPFILSLDRKMVSAYLLQKAKTEYEKTLAAFLFTTSRMTYNKKALAGDIFLIPEGVCATYAYFFRILAEDLGLRARGVCSDDAGDHMWSAVWITDTMYWLDCTGGLFIDTPQGFLNKYWPRLKLENFKERLNVFVYEPQS